MMEVRPASMEDMDGVLCINDQVADSTGVIWTKEMVYSTFADSRKHVLVAADDREIRGYIVIAVALDEGEIDMVAVHNRYQRMGIGSQLIRKAIELCLSLSLRALFLEVNARNNAAIQLYESRGFKRIAVRDNYYQQDAAHVYQMDLFTKSP